MAGGDTGPRNNGKAPGDGGIGRPPVIDEKVLRKLEEAFAYGCSDLEACFYADISKTALYEYQKDHPEFTERKELLKEKPILMARQSVIKAMQKDGNLALRYLERRKKSEFATNPPPAPPPANPITFVNMVPTEPEE